jgi:hypothetical protein
MQFERGKPPETQYATRPGVCAKRRVCCSGVPAITCFCRQQIWGSDTEHAMSCNRLSRSRSRWHNDWKEPLSRTSARAGCNGRQEPQADIEVTLPAPSSPILLDIF